MKSVGGTEFSVSPEFSNFSGSEEEAIAICPGCGLKGTKVFPTTLYSHLNEKYWHLVDGNFRFSPTRDCDVVYFNNKASLYFLMSDVKTPYGPKMKEGIRPVCYCIGVTDREIEREIVEKGCCDSLEDVEQYTKAGTGKWCFVTNPSGKCCREYLPDVVQEYLSKVTAPVVREKLEKVSKELKGETVDYRDIELRVSGMSCESCAVSVRTALENIGGVNVDVKLLEGKARVKLPKSLLPEDAAKAITDVGYEAEVIQTRELRDA